MTSLVASGRGDLGKRRPWADGLRAGRLLATCRARRRGIYGPAFFISCRFGPSIPRLADATVAPFQLTDPPDVFIVQNRGGWHRLFGVEATMNGRLLGSGRAWTRPWQGPEAPPREQVVAAPCRATTAVAAGGVVGAAAAEGIAGGPRAGSAPRDQVPPTRLD
jgi:hypothetical protein